MTSSASDPLLLVDIHHSGHYGWGVWVDPEAPERWTAETIERLMRCPHYKMGINLGAQSYEQNPRLARRIREWLRMSPNRVYVSGGDYAQLTACVRTGESNLRQIMVGIEEIERTLGTRPTLWTMSEPGNFAQLPQVLKEYGYAGALLRIHGPGQGGSLTTSTDAASVWWKGPDGTKILAVPEYDGDRLSPRDEVPWSMWMMTRYRSETAARGNFTLDDLWQWKEKMAARGISPVVMSKDDDHNNQYTNRNLCMTCGHLLAEDVETDERFRWVNDTELLDLAPEPTETYDPDDDLFETRKDCFCDYGHHDNRDWVADLAAETKLLTADFASVLAAETGSPADTDADMSAAWKSHLGAQNHDLALKQTFFLMVHLQYEAGRMADAVRDRCLDAVMGRIPTAEGENANGAIVVLNPSGVRRREYVTVSVPAELAKGTALWSETGPCPWEVVAHDAELMTMGFVADVPPLGYHRYFIRTEDSVGATAASVEGLTVTTPEYTVTFGEGGGIASLAPGVDGRSVVGAEGIRLLANSGEKLLRNVGTVAIERGPVSAVATETGRLGEHYAYTLRYRMTPGVPYVMVSLHAIADFVEKTPGAPGPLGDATRKLELSAALAEHLRPTTCTREQPMLISPYSVEMSPIFAAPRWVDYAGRAGEPAAPAGEPAAPAGGPGLALLNRGAIGQRWDVDRAEANVILSYGVVGELNAELAIMPHAGDWRSAAVNVHGNGYGTPMHAAFEPPHKGDLPGEMSLASVEQSNVAVSSVFQRNGRSYVRLWEVAGEPAPVRFTRNGEVLDAQRVSLELKDSGRPNDLGPKEIGTYRLP